MCALAVCLQNVMRSKQSGPTLRECPSCCFCVALRLLAVCGTRQQLAAAAVHVCMAMVPPVPQ